MWDNNIELVSHKIVVLFDLQSARAHGCFCIPQSTLYVYNPTVRLPHLPRLQTASESGCVCTYASVYEMGANCTKPVQGL